MENNFVQTERETDRQTFLNLFKFKKKVQKKKFRIVSRVFFINCGTWKVTDSTRKKAH